MDLVYHLGPDAHLIILPASILIKNAPIGELHAIVKYHDQYIEPQRYDRYYDNKISSKVWGDFDYETTMKIATLYGTRDLSTNNLTSEENNLIKLISDKSLWGFNPIPGKKEVDYTSSPFTNSGQG